MTAPASWRSWPRVIRNFSNSANVIRGHSCRKCRNETCSARWIYNVFNGYSSDLKGLQQFSCSPFFMSNLFFLRSTEKNGGIKRLTIYHIRHKLSVMSPNDKPLVWLHVEIITPHDADVK